MFKAIIALSLFVASLQKKQVPSLKDIEDYNDPVLKEIFQKIPKTSTSNYNNKSPTIGPTEYNQQHFIGNLPSLNQHFPTLPNTNQRQTPEVQSKNNFNSYQNVVLTPNTMAMLANDGYNAFINGAKQLTNTIPATLSNGAFMLLG